MAGWSKHGNAGVVCDIWISATEENDRRCRQDVCAPGLRRIAGLLRRAGFWFHRCRAGTVTEPDAAGGPSDLHSVGLVIYAAGVWRNRQRVERAFSDVDGLRGG